INVWAEIVGDMLIGPHMLPSRLRGPSNRQFLRRHLPRLFEDVPLNTRRQMWFMHDERTRQILSHRFPQRHQCDRIWPPHSPDINPCDYFLWGFLKEQVFHQHPESMAELRACIMQVCSTIDEDLCRRVVQNMNVRLEELVRQNGGHIEHVLR
ncbi:hypothetical protein L798_06126, partial [Zootermopsis nevadensis]